MAEKTKTRVRGPLRALTRLSLRKSPDRKSPLWDEWHVWEAETVFDPPAHMMVELAIERGIAEVVKPGTKTKVKEVPVDEE